MLRVVNLTELSDQVVDRLAEALRRLQTRDLGIEPLEPQVPTAAAEEHMGLIALAPRAGG